MPIEKVIVLEDDLVVRKSLEQYLRQRRLDVASATTLAAAQEFLAKDNFDLVFASARLPDGDGMELLKALQFRPQRPIVVMMAGSGSIEAAVECMRHGAFEYLTKPFSNDQIDVTLKRAQDFTRLVSVNQYHNQVDDDDNHELMGRSEAMEDLRQLVRKVGRTQATVLIQGESGTGKELVARMLHRESPRANAPFIKINCAAVPENLIESEFFGHEKGAFTGAVAKREGRFELAHGGTLLLDEISEISPTLQAKLLRVLQERELERVGGNRTLKVDVRVIATTNRRLEDSVARHEFRQDLYFRLNVVPIWAPPLRERPEDIPFLAEQFVRRFARKHGARVKGISDDCLRVMSEHSWPGNVRELQNVIERAVILTNEGGLLEPEDLGLTNGHAFAAPSTVAARSLINGRNGSASDHGNGNGNGNGFPTLAKLEQQHILDALEHCKGNRTHAAKALDISIRTLRNKLNEYNGKSHDSVIDCDEEEEAAVTLLA